MAISTSYIYYGCREEYIDCIVLLFLSNPVLYWRFNRYDRITHLGRKNMAACMHVV